MFCGDYNYRKEKAMFQSEYAIGIHYSHNFTRPNVKRGIGPEDFGEHGIVINFDCTRPFTIPHGSPIPAMEKTVNIRLENIGLEISKEISTGLNPPPHLIDEIRGIFSEYTDILKRIDLERMQ